MIKLTRKTKCSATHLKSYIYILTVKHSGNVHPYIEAVATNSQRIMESINKYRRLGRLDNSKTYDLTLYVYRQNEEDSLSLAYTQYERVNFLPDYNL